MTTIARINNDRKLQIANEIIEYPSQLDGGRNLWFKPPNINIVDYEIGHDTEYPVNSRFSFIGYSSGTSRLRIEDGNIEVVFRENTSTSYYVTLEIKGLLPNTEYVISYTRSHVGDLGGRRLYRLFGRTYVNNDYGARQSNIFTTDNEGKYNFEVWRDNADLRREDIVFEISDIKLELGENPTGWTPAPEDLGLVYPEDINYFSTGFRSDGKMLVREFIEGEDFRLSQEKKLYFEEVEEGVDLNG